MYSVLRNTHSSFLFTPRALEDEHVQGIHDSPIDQFRCKAPTKGIQEDKLVRQYDSTCSILKLRTKGSLEVLTDYGLPEPDTL